MAYVIKAEIRDPRAETFTFAAQKTMYGGKRIAGGDTAYLFASETQGGTGLIARATVTAAASVQPRLDLDRQTPRVTVTVQVTARPHRPLGRADLKPRTGDQPGAELNFKFYRQATNKIAGISDAEAAFLEGFFQA